MFLYKTPCDCCTRQQYLTLISRLADARWFLTTAGLVSLSQTLPDVPRDATENHSFPGPLQRIPGAPGVSTPSLGHHHHPGVYERNDRPPTLQETQRRGENNQIYLQLWFITNQGGKLTGTWGKNSTKMNKNTPQIQDNGKKALSHL